MSLTPDTTLGAYRIVAALGHGGMGEVYRAHDPRLARDVALKVLPADMAGDPMRLERFTREARAIAALNHPHIVTIYSTEEADGIRFITMELVDGESLDARIPASGMPLAQFLEVALPLADALNAAHQKQITHRDLKPANVMVTMDGRVKVLDFGLASAPLAGLQPGPAGEPGPTAVTSPQVTTPGMVIGTMPYMSPEQVEGKSLDHRTDLFSLGVMFHEMLVGTRPFIGDSPPQLMSSILRDTPASVREVRPDLPEALDRLIHRCLEKRADDRVQTARDVFNELRHVQKQFDSGQTRRPASDAHSTIDDALWIAVLPFTVRGQDADGVVLGDGLTEDITAGLTRFPSLSVVAAQSALGFKVSPLDVRQIADRLNARYIVGGSVRRSTTGTRVIAHLTDARSGAQLWTETYDRGADADVYAVQDEVTDRVVATIADKSGVLVRSMVQAVRKIPLAAATSRQLVLRCWGMEAHPTAADHAELRAALESYVAIHPDDADIWAELSHLYSHEYWLGFNALPDPVARAERAARRAIELDSAHQLGWQRLAMTAQCFRDEHGLAEAAERAIAINPRNVNTLARIGSILTYTGEYDRGCELTERAIALNPQHPGWYHFAFFNRRFARGEFAEALKAARRVNVPDLMRMHFAIAAAAGHLGLARDGAAAVQAMIARTPEMADDSTLRDFVTRWYWDADLIESLLEGVRRSRGGSGASDVVKSRATVPSSDVRSGINAGATAIGVLPFTAHGHDGDTTGMAAGLTEDVTAALSRFSYLSVAAQHAAERFHSAGGDLRGAREGLGARYLLDGSVRRTGTHIRIAARVMDTATEQQLWGEIYDRDQRATGALAVQDDITDRIVATVADVYGVLMRSMSHGLRERPLDTLSVNETLLRYWSYQRQPEPSEHAALRARLEQIVEAQPHQADCWAAVADLYCQEVAHGFNPLPDPLVRAHRAVARALDIDAVHHHAWHILAVTCYFERDTDGFVHAAERALALNPRNTNTTAFLAFLFSQLGEPERACEMTERAMTINPAYPGWYHFVFFDRLYGEGEYARALAAARKINMPQNLWSHWSVAICAGQLGRAADAAAALDAFFALAPALQDLSLLRQMQSGWRWNRPDKVDQTMEGFAKAVALRDAILRDRSSSPSIESQSAAASATGVSPSSTSDLRPGTAPLTMRMAVLPFTARAGDDHAAALADGITDDLTAGLSRFAYLRVVSRARTSGLAAGSSDLRAAGRQLEARYLLEGSVRSAGTSVRISARLVEAETGAHLWAESFDRELSAGTFAVQDDVAGRIVSRVADPSGVLVRAMVALLKTTPDEALTVSELTLLYFAHLEQLGAEQHARLRAGLERALAGEPENATGWACLADLYAQEQILGHNPLPDPIERQRRAAERAIAIDATCQYGWVNLAASHYHDRDLAAFHHEAERAIALNPLDTHVLTYVGSALALAGNWNRGAALIRQALELNPNLPGHVHLIPFLDAYRRGEDEAALAAAKKISIPGLHSGHFARAVAGGQLQRREEARIALDDLRRVRPEMTDAATARSILAAWLHDEPLVDRLIEGLEKALALIEELDAAKAPSWRDAMHERLPKTRLRKFLAEATGRVRPDDKPAAAPAPPPAPVTRSPESAAGLNTDAFVVTVLQFTAPASGGDAAELADGLTQAIAVGLARFSHLRVVTRRAAVQSVTAGYALHGSVRSAGGVVRVVAQLTEAATGQSLWAETYDRRPDTGSIFDLQDELTEKIVATIADVNGALVRAMAITVRAKPAETLTPYEAVVRALAYFSLMSPEEHAELRTALERAVERAPNYADAWGALAYAYSEEHAQSYNLRSQAVERAQAAVRRALELDSSNQLAYFTLGRLAFLARDRSALRAATDRLIALNPLAPHIISFLGMATAYTGDWEAGLKLCERAMSLNPHHSGIYRMPFVIDAYRRRDYAVALEILDRVNMPSFPMTSMARAAIYAQLGRMDEALSVWREADTRIPGYSERIHVELSKWFAPELVGHIDEAIGKIRQHAAGRGSEGAAFREAALRPTEPRTASIAVLPFADLSAEKNQDWFCDGIAEEILNALTQLPGLRVAARTSAFSLRDQGSDLRGIAEKLGVATVLHGTVRRAGDRLRVTVQLVDVSNGFQLWSDRYDRELQDIFDVQDEIARAVADHLKITLTGGTGERLVAPVTRNLEAYELLLKGRTLQTRRGRAILDALQCFERAVALDPNLAEAHALLGDSYRLLALYGIAPATEMMPKARAAAERALVLDPRQVEACATLANITAVYDWNVAAGLALSNRALAIDPSHVRTLGERSIVPFMLASPPAHVVEMAMANARRARELDPLSAWVASIECFCLLLNDRTDEAVVMAHQAVALDAANFTAHWVLVWTLSAAGRHDNALAAAEPALAMSGRNPRLLTEVAAIHAARGDRAKAAAIHDELQFRAASAYIGFAEQGAAAASAGRIDEARALVTKSLSARDSFLVFWRLPSWGPFRRDHKGARLLDGAGFMTLSQ